MTKDEDQGSLSDLELLEKLDRIDKDAKGYRKEFEDDWRENERFYRGEHWKHSKKRPVKNWCFTIVEGEIPILVGNSRPTSNIVPLDDEHIEDAKLLESAVQHVFQNQNAHMKVVKASRTSLKVGTGWLYVDWDHECHNGQGEVIIQNESYRHVYLDPAANDIDEAKYAKIERPMDIEDIKRMFPDKADKIEKQTVDSGSIGKKRQEFLDPEKWHPDGTSDEGKGRYAGYNMTVLEEYWLKDYTMEAIPEEETNLELQVETEELMRGINPDIGQYENHDAHIEAHSQMLAEFQGQAEMLAQAGQDISGVELAIQIIQDHIESHKTFKEINPKGQRPKYNANLRLVMKTGKVILFDDEAPVNDGMIPLVPIYCYWTEDSIYGIGEIQNIKNPQKSFNEMDWAELQGLRLTGNSGWVVDEESGVDQDTLTNEPGLVVKKKQGTEVQRLQPGQVSPQLAARKISDQQSMEFISGIQEASQGRRPEGISAGIAIERLQSAVVGRVQLKSQALEEYSMPRLTKLVASRVVKYYTTERKLRIYDANGRLQFVQYDPDKIQDLEYDVRAVPGEKPMIDKGEVFAVMKQLLEAQLIDPITFFETTDLPYRGKIIQKLEEQNQQADQMEALMLENQALKEQLGIPSEEEMAQVQADEQALSEAERAVAEQEFAQSQQPV